ncbi:histidine--tRNA ligase [Lachnoclostridium sp. An196]|uniref:histidine--tRNA ligase n=1 Tax=Lachnoclostridium sp. An196 TaxID=1965583 RepID=UPI000B3ACFB3|nr:histidine--tRNA ligase [Lachnoclostridium sp. An196]OUP20279.1 histidine--tRNA ligase [Lachnoclostridium sp. An196]HIS07696.1 histidine--tRNA ligase [Candidatus Choladocola avistercoris]
MTLKKKPVTGMKDILPAEMQLRDYVTGLIKETYKSFGFSPIETPCVEHIENLCSKQGGDNEKLIFKIMKRGEKLNLEQAKEEADLTDSGLRYDLTVPLSRFYANNANDLPAPFKALQIGSVWRADRPQRGRFRQFVQCDIDILGEASCLAEIELILATTTLLGKLNFKDFKVRINERRILKAMAAYSGFTEDQYDQVFIILDKMDKIGWDGVKAELLEAGYPEKNVETYVSMFGEMENAKDSLVYLEEKLSGVLEDGVIDNLRMIRESVEATAAAQFRLIFDPTLVRGMSYYTGTIFEIEMAEFGSSVAGGGRYDKMIGKFTGKDTPACGFSIGFERIVTILMEQGFRIPGAAVKKAFLVEKNMPAEKLCEVLKEAKAERETGAQVLVALMNKNKKFQKEQLAKEGYTEFKEYFNR